MLGSNICGAKSTWKKKKCFFFLDKGIIFYFKGRLFTRGTDDYVVDILYIKFHPVIAMQFQITAVSYVLDRQA